MPAWVAGTANPVANNTNTMRPICPAQDASARAAQVAWRAAMDSTLAAADALVVSADALRKRGMAPVVCDSAPPKAAQQGDEWHIIDEDGGARPHSV